MIDTQVNRRLEFQAAERSRRAAEFARFMADLQHICRRYGFGIESASEVQVYDRNKEHDAGPFAIIGVDDYEIRGL